MSGREKMLIEQTREALKRALTAEAKAAKMNQLLQEKQIPEPGHAAAGFGPCKVAAGAYVTMNMQPAMPILVRSLYVYVESSPESLQDYVCTHLKKMRDLILDRIEKPTVTKVGFWSRFFRWSKWLAIFQAVFTSMTAGFKKTVDHCYSIASNFQPDRYDRYSDRPTSGDLDSVSLTEFRVGRTTLMQSNNPIPVKLFGGTLNEGDVPQGPAFGMVRCQVGNLIALSFVNNSPVPVVISGAVVGIKDEFEIALTDSEISQILHDVNQEVS